MAVGPQRSRISSVSSQCSIISQKPTMIIRPYNHQSLPARQHRALCGCFLRLAVCVLVVVLLPSCTRTTTRPSVRASVSQGNTVIAVQLNTVPDYTLAIHKPDSGWNVPAGQYITEPAVAVWVYHPRQPTAVADTTLRNLSDTEWQTVEGWRQTWCDQAPTVVPPTTTQPHYRVGLRCGIGFKNDQYLVAPDTMPSEIIQLFHQISGGHW